MPARALRRGRGRSSRRGRSRTRSPRASRRPTTHRTSSRNTPRPWVPQSDDVGDRHLDLLARVRGQVDVQSCQPPELCRWPRSTGPSCPSASSPRPGSARMNGWMSDQPAGAAVTGRLGGVPVGVRQRRPVVGADLVRLDEHEVPVRLGVVATIWNCSVPDGRAGQVDGAGEPLVGGVRLLAVDVPVAVERVERRRSRAGSSPAGRSSLNCGNCAGGRKLDVVRNEAVWSWLFAESAAVQGAGEAGERARRVPPHAGTACRPRRCRRR